MEENKSFVYILRCADDTLYTGYTTNLKRRVAEHQKGSKKCKYTMATSRRPVTVASSWSIKGPRGYALRVEAFIKKLIKSKKLSLIKDPGQLSEWYHMKSGNYIECDIYSNVEGENK